MPNQGSLRSSRRDWLAWFLATLHRAVDHAQRALDAVLAKVRFWQRFAGIAMNGRQVKVLNRLLDGFEGRLTTGKWAAIAKCSPDSALRDINALIALGALRGPSFERIEDLRAPLHLGHFRMVSYAWVSPRSYPAPRRGSSAART